MDFRMANVTREDYNAFDTLHRNFRYAELKKEEEIPCVNLRVKTYEEYADLAEKEWIYFAVEDGKVTGYVIITPYEDGSVKLEEIYIASNEQRRGSGRMFVSLLKAFLKKEGFNRIFLLSYNMATDQFWFRCYFRPVNNSEEFEFIIK